MSPERQGPEAGPGRRFAWRPIVLVLVGIVGLIAVAWGALVILLPPARVNEIVRDQLSRTLSRDVRFDGASVGLWPPVRLTVHEPALAEPGGFARGAAFRARQLHLDLDVLALLGHRVVVRRLVLDDPVLHLALHADGTTNLDGLAKPQPPGAQAQAPMDLEVRDLALHDARLILDDGRTHRRTTLLVDTRLSLASLAGGRRLDTAGTTRLTGLAFGPDTEGRLSALDHSFAKLALEVRHQGSFDAAAKRLTLESLELGLGRAKLGFRGTVTDPGPHTRLDLHARGDGIDFGEILGFLAAADAPAVQGVRGSGRLRFDLGIAGLLGSATPPALTGALQVSDASFKTPQMPKSIEALNARVDLTPTSAALRGLTGRAGRSSWTLDATVARPLAVLAKAGATPPSDVSFSFAAPLLDVADVQPAGNGPMLPFNARGGGDVRIGRFINQKLDVTNVRARIALTPNHLDVPSFGLDAYGGRIAGAASLGLENAAKPTFALKGRADSLSTDAFLSTFTPAHGVLTGIASTNFDLSGEGALPDQIKRSITALGLAAVLDGKLSSPVFDAIAQIAHVPALRHLEFHEARLPFHVVRGQVVTDSVRFAGPSCGEWKVSGGIGFDGALDYAVSATLPADVVNRLGARAALAAGALADDQGRVLLDLTVGGTARAPRVGLNTQAMRDRLAGKASRALTEEGQKLKGQLMERALGAARGDSGAAKPPDLKSQLKQDAGGLLQNLLGKKKPAPPPPPTDTTKH
jgi:hypothetical protein